MVNVKAKPFYLDDEGVKWVEETLASMSIQEKVGQIFFPVGISDDEQYLKQLVDGIQPGGIMYRPGPKESVQKTHNYLQSRSKLPLLTAANLEVGGQGIASEGTMLGNQLQVAATDDSEMAYKLGVVSAKEGGAVGCNWAFAPVVDIDINFRNPITNVRTYGSDVERVTKMGSAYMRGCHEHNMAVSIKHFPGDGVDERDHHLLTSVNSLTKKEWDESYGKVYQTLIDEGADTVMIGHIALPAYENHFNGQGIDHEPIPATLSPTLLQKLLREQLGFNGLICTDATPMLGFCVAEKRSVAVPQTIANGCDVLLFNVNIEEDFKFMMDGISQGILSLERVDEAVTRILALKARLKLHEQKQSGTILKEADDLEMVGCKTHQAWAAECADQAVTLVKDTQALLPLDPVKHKRVLLYPIGTSAAMFSLDEEKIPFYNSFVEQMEVKGFEIEVKFNEKPDFAAMFNRSVTKFSAEYDLVIYLVNLTTASNQTAVRLSYDMMTNAPWFVKEVETMLISTANPYHLIDAPMIKTFINAYSFNEHVIQFVVEKICGQSTFKGTNPIDPFCGRKDTRY